MEVEGERDGARRNGTVELVLAYAKPLSRKGSNLRFYQND